MPYFEHEAIRFYYRQVGHGRAVVFQHGFGGTVTQPLGLVTPPPGFRLMAFDCRGHGGTRPLGDPARIRISTLADDLHAWLRHLQVTEAVVGGISLGAAVALNFALRYPQCTSGLILSRPAWLDVPNRQNTRWYGEVADLLRRYGRVEGAERFRQSETWRALAEAPAVVESMLSFFTHPRAEELMVVMEQLTDDAPCRDLRELARIAVPALVLGNRQDPVHPLEFATTLAAAIPGATFAELTAKSVSAEQHQQDVQRQITQFLHEHFP